MLVYIGWQITENLQDNYTTILELLQTGSSNPSARARVGGASAEKKKSLLLATVKFEPIIEMSELNNLIQK